MGLKIFKRIIITLILSGIPAFLSYLACSSLVFDKMIEKGLLSENIDVPLVQDYCLWIGLAFSALALSINLIVTKIKYDHMLEQRNSLIKMSKHYLISSLGRRFLSDSSKFDVRIFIPKHPIMYKIADKFHIKKIRKKFVIKNIELIAEQGVTKGLNLEVFPKQEGLVGLCYQEKAMVYDDDLEHTNSNSYNLSQNQIAKTASLKWSICCPVCDDNNLVLAIIALDGTTKITIDREREEALREEMLVFSRLLFDSVPQLFKR